MATLSELELALVNADKAGDTEAATALARAIVRARSATAANQRPDPMEGIGLGQRILEGIGQGMSDIPMGLGQRVGLVSQQQADERARLDAPLLETGGGLAGSVIGKGIPAAATALIPGANTVAGAGAIGAGMGAIEPTKTGDSVIGNMLQGAFFNALLPGVVAGGKALKSALDPFHARGQERIVAETLKRFSGDPQRAAAALRNPNVIVPGTKPTVGELMATTDPGLAVLQRSAMSADPQIAGAFSAREAQNASARLAAIQKVAGEPGQKEFFEASRNAAANELYERAFSEVPADSKWIKGEITKLMKRPAFIDALKEGQVIAANKGLRLGRGGKFREEDSARILHYTKRALDIQAEKTTGEAKQAILETKAKVISLLESKGFSPSYREARDTYAKMSRPINQMEIGQELLNRVKPALADFAGDPAALPRVRAEAYAQALRNADETAKRVTGFRGARMESVMEPEQMQSLTGVARDLSRRAMAQEAGKVSGSPTAQYLASQNLMRQIAGPLGMPQSWVESALMQTAARPIDFMAKRAEPIIQKRLAEVMLNPEVASGLLSVALKEQPVLLGLLSRYLPVTVGAGLLSYSGQ